MSAHSCPSNPCPICAPFVSPYPGFGYPHPTVPWPGDGQPWVDPEPGRSWATPRIVTNPEPARLSDEDVERIAQRVAEILRGKAPS